MAHKSEKPSSAGSASVKQPSTKMADRKRSVRVSVVLIIRRSRVQAPAAPLVFPQVRRLRSVSCFPKSPLSRAMWHIYGTSRNLNPPVVVRVGPAPLTSSQVKRLRSRPGRLAARARGTSMAHARMKSTRHHNGGEGQFGRTQAVSRKIGDRSRSISGFRLLLLEVGTRVKGQSKSDTRPSTAAKVAMRSS